MKRSETTAFLSDLLVNNRLSGMGKHYACEVVLDSGTNHAKRIDFVLFEPKGGIFPSDIEKGIFTCYEIKSCKEDVYSGRGINFFGEKNYFVMTMQTYKQILPDLKDGSLARYIKANFPESSKYWGVIVSVPSYREVSDEFENPTEIEECDDWSLKVIVPCREGRRERSMVEMLFCMLRSGTE